MINRWAVQIRQAREDGKLRSLGISEVDAGNILKIVDPDGEKKIAAMADKTASA